MSLFSEEDLRKNVSFVMDDAKVYYDPTLDRLNVSFEGILGETSASMVELVRENRDLKNQLNLAVRLLTNLREDFANVTGKDTTQEGIEELATQMQSEDIDDTIVTEVYSGLIAGLAQRIDTLEEELSNMEKLNNVLSTDNSKLINLCGENGINADDIYVDTSDSMEDEEDYGFEDED